MRTLTSVSVALAMLLIGCGEPEGAAPTAFVAEFQHAGVPVPSGAHLSGASEVPANDSDARGQAIFLASGDAIRFRLQVANIENVLQAHIHLAAAGANGPIVAWLYPPAPPAQLIPDAFNGTLGEGTLTAANLMGPLAGMTIQDLLDAMRAGDTYVNVHTSQFPPGEIRGQIRVRGR